MIRRLVAAGILVLGGILVLLAVTAATTDYESQRLALITGSRAVTPAPWSRPCWRRNPHGPARYTLPCGRADGRVLYVQKVDPDGDSDAHFVVIAGPRLVVVKVRRGQPAGGLPSIGDRVTAVGPLQSGRFGINTIDLRRSRAKATLP